VIVHDGSLKVQYKYIGHVQFIQDRQHTTVPAPQQQRVQFTRTRTVGTRGSTTHHPPARVTKPATTNGISIIAAFPAAVTPTTPIPNIGIDGTAFLKITSFVAASPTAPQVALFGVAVAVHVRLNHLSGTATQTNQFQTSLKMFVHHSAVAAVAAGSFDPPSFGVVIGMGGCEHGWYFVLLPQQIQPAVSSNEKVTQTT
jgi:hypothetical protein